jgi:hypothetical protein
MQRRSLGRLQVEREAGAGSRPVAVRADAATHRFDQALRDRQAETEPGRALAGSIELLERVEDPFQILRRDSHAAVGNADLNPVSGAIERLDHDFTLSVRMLDRVSQQVRHYLVKASAIGVRELAARGEA